jgi:hypothetical protein
MKRLLAGRMNGDEHTDTNFLAFLDCSRLKRISLMSDSALMAEVSER